MKKDFSKKIYLYGLVSITLIFSPQLRASVESKNIRSISELNNAISNEAARPLKPNNIRFKKRTKTTVAKIKFTPIDQKPKFDVPVTYNKKVKKWVLYFQKNGKHWFESRLGISSKYLPMMQRILSRRDMPNDLAYIAMIESGFSAKATSHAQAVGYWQFIKPTANQYGLRTNWWIDERRDFKKSTLAATSYLSDLYKKFGSWYLTASAYNMGETRLRRLIKKYRTRNFWVLSQFKDFPRETREYIPKLIATMLIAKSPKLYGFHNVKPKKPYSFDSLYIPGGTDLVYLSGKLGIKKSTLMNLNPELKRNFIPSHIKEHRIRVPKGMQAKTRSIIKNL